MNSTQTDSAFMATSIVIIGAGKVGSCLKQLMDIRGYRVTLSGRDSATQKAEVSIADIVIIATQDSQIETVCNELSPAFRAETIVSHCSGALNSKALNSAKSRGCYVASTHPLNTFPNLTSSLRSFADTRHGSYLYAEGHSKALAALMPLYQELGFEAIEIPTTAKTAYHTACVFAGNYLTVLMEASMKIAESAQIDRKTFWLAIQPLIHSTINNIGEYGTADALSGPIARGDTSTVAKHLDELSQHNDILSSTYVELGKHALHLAERKGEISPEKMSQLNDILK